LGSNPLRRANNQITVQSSASATRLATYYGITPEKSGIGF
jgi:hypothetical protein